MSHYFISDPDVKNVEYLVKFNLLNREIELNSASGVFCKDRVDKGSYLLLQEAVKLPLFGKVLDFGAGIGTIGITLNLFFSELELTYCEINRRAIELIKKNLNKYSLNGTIVEKISEINLFDFAFLNPPIRIGKENIFNIYKDIYESLKENGEFYIVIRKDKGMLSHKAFLETIFKKVEVIGKDKGYFVLKMIK